MFKYELGQLIYYFLENTIHSAEIMSRIKVENLKEEWASTKAQADMYTAFGRTRVEYSTCHGVIPEICAFASKRELVESLMEDEK